MALSTSLTQAFIISQLHSIHQSTARNINKKNVQAKIYDLCHHSLFQPLGMYFDNLELVGKHREKNEEAAIEYVLFIVRQ